MYPKGSEYGKTIGKIAVILDSNAPDTSKHRVSDGGYVMREETYSCKPFLNEDRAVRILVLTVPNGQFVSSAISLWVFPSKNAISRYDRWSGGSRGIKIRAFSIMRFNSASLARS